MFRSFGLLFMACSLFAADTAMFRGDAAHSGVYEGTAPPSLSSIKWKFKTQAKIFSSPAVSGSSVYFGSADHSLYAVNAADGSLRWKFRTKSAVNSSPAIAEGMVYVGSVDGNFYSVDAETGKQVWKFTTSGESRFTAPGIHGMAPSTQLTPDPFDVFLSSPVVAGGIAYFGSGDHNVYAVDAKTGALKWKFATGNVVHASPAVANGVVYIGSWDRNMYALDASTGAVKWKFQTGDDTEIYNQVGIAGSAAVAGGIVYFGCRDGFFYAVDAKTGELKWKHNNQKGWVIASPAIQNGVVYFPTSDGTRFLALNATTGEVAFSVVNKAISFSSPAISGKVAYFGSSDGWLHAIDVKTGAMKAEFQTEGSKQNSSKYIDDKGRIMDSALYKDMDFEGIILGLDKMYSLGSVLSSPVVANGVVYFGSTDGNLYAVN